MNFWLIKFKQNVSDKSDDVYPKKTIYQIAFSLKRHLYVEELTWILTFTGKFEETFYFRPTTTEFKFEKETLIIHKLNSISLPWWK